jgi:DNA-binding GntR family transcriptional regulator
MTARRALGTTPDAAAAPGSPGAPTDADIHGRIVQALLDQRLWPGTRLREDELGEVFGVSRTRIRQVLIRLASERLVTLRPHAGASVAEPNEREAREVFNARRLIEPSLVASAVRRLEADDLARLAALIADEERQRMAGERGAAIRLAGDFHLTIALLADDTTLERFARELVSRTSLVLMRFGPKDHGESQEQGGCRCHDHRGLLAAMKLRDADAAARLMLDHLQRLESQLVFAPPASRPRPLADLLGAV